MKNVILLLSLIIATSGAIAQGDKLVEANNAAASGDWKKAKMIIDEASQDSKYTQDPTYYYLRGAIYMEMYKAEEKGVDPNSPLREEAFNAFKSFKNFEDQATPDEINAVTSGLKQVTANYWNDAVTNANIENYETAISNYERFRQASMMVDPSNDISDKDVKFYTKIATLYVQLYEQNAGTAEGEMYFEKARDEYKKIIDLDKGNLTANYNLGIQYYNKAVNIIKDLDVETSLEELAEKEDECVELFLQALPYMKAAYDLDPYRKETLIGLTGIYWSLNDLEKYQEYQEKLKALD